MARTLRQAQDGQSGPSAVSEESASNVAAMAAAVKSNICEVLVGKEPVIELTLTALLSGGHILVEDVPGIGKTTLARSLAESLRCSFRRIQCTPDLMPSDITGVHYFNQKLGEFEFRPRSHPGAGCAGGRNQPGHATNSVGPAGGRWPRGR